MTRTTNQLRLIGGRFRGRRLPFPDQPGLRPTPDRVRETLFNWLAPVIVGARCLDAFAGSGALGFEAASRGAGEVVLIERSPLVARQLQVNAQTLGAAEVRIQQADTLQWLAAAGHPFDIVFLDPPFADDLLMPAIAHLAEHGWLAPGAASKAETRALAARYGLAVATPPASSDQRPAASHDTTAGSWRLTDH